MAVNLAGQPSQATGTARTASTVFLAAHALIALGMAIGAVLTVRASAASDAARRSGRHRDRRHRYGRHPATRPSCAPQASRTTPAIHGAGRIVRKAARRAWIAKTVTPHTLRHAFITAALDAGVPLLYVQEAASHADPRTTMRHDRARGSLDRHAAYIVAAYVAGAAR